MQDVKTQACEYCGHPIKADQSTTTTVGGNVYHEVCYETARENAMATAWGNAAARKAVSR